MLEMIRHIVEEGVGRGLDEARNEWEGASDDQIVELISDAVISGFHVYFEFDETVE